MAARGRLGVVVGTALLALMTLYPILRSDEARAAGQGVTLGVTVGTLSEVQRDRIGYTADGILVKSVAPEGPAGRAGIVKGDILVVVGSVTLRSVDDFDKALSKLEAGEEVAVVVARNGGRFIKVLNVVPDSLPEEASEPAADPTPAPLEESAEPPVPFQKSEPVTTDSDVPPPASAVVPEAMVTKAADDPTAEAAAPAPAAAEAEKVTLASLGVECQDLDPDLASALGVSASAGALVLRVKPESPAAVAGLRSGDVVTALGSEEVAGAEQLASAVERLGREPVWHVQRKGENREVNMAPPPPPPAPEPVAEVVTPPATLSDEERRAVIAGLRTEVEGLRGELHRLRRQLERMRDRENNGGR